MANICANYLSAGDPPSGQWEKEVQAETILHPTPSMNVDGSGACVARCVAEGSSTPMDPVPPVPFHPELLSLHHLVIAMSLHSDHQYLILGAVVHKKS